MKNSLTAVTTLLFVSLLVSQPTVTMGQSFTHLTQPISGRAMRTSSGDPDWDHGGGDWRELGPSDTLVIADLYGPGVINHLWLTFGTYTYPNSNFWDGAPRDLVLKFYWDNETSPSVNVPLGDFFAVGNGKTAYLDSAVVQIGGNDTARAYNCYWPMPFAKNARLTIENQHPSNTMHKCYFHVDWIKYDAMPSSTLYFHAQFNKARPLLRGNDYLVADITGRGHYVGTVFSLVNTPGVGFGEGDDRFFIDGEAEPSIIGTGMEDYFGESWGFHNHNSLYHGFRWLSDGGMTMYRWHILDPVPFQQSLQVTFENWSGPPYSEYTWTEWSSVAFWYQQDQPINYSAVSSENWNSLK